MTDARIFQPKHKTKKKEFEFILTAIMKSYKMMLLDYESIENDENIIRNRLYDDYLNNQTVVEKLNLQPYFFDIEVPQNTKYKTTAFSDIKVYSLLERANNRQAAYFIIECKRLENTNTGKGSLNQKYVDNGIKRFIEREDYPTYYGLNGMIGFLVKSEEIDKVKDAINKLLPENEQLFRYIFSSENEFTYKSEHIDLKKKNIQLYHLILDFSSLAE